MMLLPVMDSDSLLWGYNPPTPWTASIGFGFHGKVSDYTFMFLVFNGDHIVCFFKLNFITYWYMSTI